MIYLQLRQGPCPAIDPGPMGHGRFCRPHGRLRPRLLPNPIGGGVRMRADVYIEEMSTITTEMQTCIYWACLRPTRPTTTTTATTTTTTTCTERIGEHTKVSMAPCVNLRMFGSRRTFANPHHPETWPRTGHGPGGGEHAPVHTGEWTIIVFSAWGAKATFLQERRRAHQLIPHAPKHQFIYKPPGRETHRNVCVWIHGFQWKHRT